MCFICHVKRIKINKKRLPGLVHFLKDCMLETRMLLADMRDHWYCWPQLNPLWWKCFFKKSCSFAAYDICHPIVVLQKAKGILFAENLFHIPHSSFLLYFSSNWSVRKKYEPLWANFHTRVLKGKLAIFVLFEVQWNLSGWIRKFNQLCS